MTKNDLTANQRMVLGAAANRDDHVAWPLPKLLGLSKGSATLVVKSLLKKGLVIERPAGDGEAVWREDDEDRPLTVLISEVGLEVLGLLPDEDTDAGANVQEGDKGPADSAGQQDAAPVIASPDQDAAPVIASPDAANDGATNPDTAPVAAVTDQLRQPRPGTKLAALVGLLSRPVGATVEEMAIATGWQAHSVRGVMSGALVKKFGLTIVSEKIEGRGRVYRISASG